MVKKHNDRVIVVTGGAGFIGSGVIRYLNDKKFYDILVVDDLGKSEKWKNLVGKRYLDIISRHQILEWLQKNGSQVSSFIHLGACSSTVETDASYLLENNYRFSVRLAEYAIKNKKRFIYASSAATYGDGSLGFSDEHDVIDSLYPLNMYGYSKQMFDLWLKDRGLLNKVVGLKYFNVFGPNEHHKGRMASAILRFVSEVQKEGKIRLFKSSDPKNFADGDQKRDFIYVKDAVRMTCAFLANKATGIFNIGTGKATSWNEFASSVFKAMNTKVNIEYVDMPSDLIGKYQNYTAAEMSKTRNILKSSASCTPLDEASEDYVCNHILTSKYW
jgi:ADP-L-glycero-D-manno-heptose 6-epimerase